MGKKLAVSIILFLAIFLGSKTASAEVVSGKCGDNLSYSYENGVLTIDGEGDMTSFIDSYDTPYKRKSGTTCHPSESRGTQRTQSNDS